MKSIWNDYIYTKWYTGIVTWELRNNNIVLYKGRNYSVDGFVSVDVYDLFIKDYYTINISKIMEAIQLGGVQAVHTELLNLELVWFPNIPNMEEIVPINIPDPIETEFYHLNHISEAQVIISAKNINYNNYNLELIIDGQSKLPVSKDGINPDLFLYPSRVIIVTNKSVTGECQTVELSVVDRTSGQQIDVINICELAEGCDKLNMFLITDGIQFMTLKSGKITHTNNKSTYRNKLGYDIIYDYKEGITIPAVFESVTEDLNNNYGAIVMLDDTVNYGIIDESSITRENHKQAFTIKI